MGGSTVCSRLYWAQANRTDEGHLYKPQHQVTSGAGVFLVFVLCLRIQIPAFVITNFTIITIIFISPKNSAPLIIRHPLIKMHAKPPKFAKNLLFFVKTISNFRHPLTSTYNYVCSRWAATIKAPDRLLSRNDRNKASSQLTNALGMQSGDKERLSKQNTSTAICTSSQPADGKKSRARVYNVPEVDS